MCVGLPRSGKSTWSRSTGLPIVQPDAIRLALHGERYKPEAETMVWAIARYMVKALFLAGHMTVILDATSVSEMDRRTWQSVDWFTRVKVFHTNEDICKMRAHMTGQDDLIEVIDRMLPIL